MAFPSTTSPLLLPRGSTCQDCSTFWRRPPRITNAQMWKGGESVPDSDVLQLVAGVKKKSLCQPLVCMDCMHACTHLGFRMFFFWTRVPLHISNVYIRRRKARFLMCAHVTFCGASKHFSATWKKKEGGGGFKLIIRSLPNFPAGLFLPTLLLGVC